MNNTQQTQPHAAATSHAPQNSGEPFWLVWRRGGSPPTFEHASFDSADTEAKRLARVHQGDEFVVLESARSHQVLSLVSTDLRPDRGIPF